MAYSANIPLSTDLLSQSQADLQANFQAINTFVSVNHESLNGVAPHAQGKHKQLEMPVQAAVIATDPTQWAINVVNNALGVPAPAVWFTPPVSAQHPAGTAYDITTAGLTNPGWCRLPCGIIMKWGSGTVNANNGGVAATAVLVSGAGIPTITTVLCPIVTRTGNTASEGIVTYSAFNEAAHTVTVYGVKSIAGAQATGFVYLLIGI